MNRNDLKYHKVTKEAYRFNTIGLILISLILGIENEFRGNAKQHLNALIYSIRVV